MAKNKFDKLLGRNGELVKLRKEQVLAGAMRIIQQHYADKQNKMEAVAQLFGKKLDEEFKVKSAIRNPYSATVVFTSSGLFLRGRSAVVVNRMMILDDLLTGEAVIIDND